LPEQTRMGMTGAEFQTGNQILHAVPIQKRRMDFIEGGRMRDAASAKPAGVGGGHRIRAARTTGRIVRQLQMAWRTKIASCLARISAQDTGWRKQRLLYNIEPVVHHFSMNRLISFQFTLPPEIFA
jgi:hypothetical protein